MELTEKQLQILNNKEDLIKKLNSSNIYNRKKNNIISTENEQLNYQIITLKNHVKKLQKQNELL